MHNFLENAPSKTGGKSGGGRGNNPPRNGMSASAGWPSKTGEPHKPHAPQHLAARCHPHHSLRP